MAGDEIRPMAADGNDLDGLIARWRDYRRQRPEPPPPGIEHLERRLRDEAAALLQTGLTADEAFMVAIRRLSAQDAPTAGFGRQLWPPTALPPAASANRLTGAHPAAAPARPADMAAAIILAIAAAAAIKIPALLGYPLADGYELVYILNLSLFVLPMVAAYFAWQRRLSPRRWLTLALPFLAAAALINAYPFTGSSASTAPLTAIHLPIALWLIAGFAYTGGGQRSGPGSGHWSGQWMEFIRFTGEFAIYYLLIALGGGALTLLGWALFDAIGVDPSGIVQAWILPCGAMGAAPICAWLVESRRRVIENLAPMLARVFTPLVAALLIGFLLTMAITGQGINAEREVLIAFDLLLALVLALLLYSVSARPAQAPPNALDWLTALLTACALIADAVALAAIAARITEFGLSPNKIAALGENLLLLINLTWALAIYARILRRRAAFAALEQWQTAYLPVFAAWAGIVAVAFPPVFGYA